MTQPKTQPPRWTGRSRHIEIWCEEPSHDPVQIGELVSVRAALFEEWKARGDHVDTQQLVPPGADTDPTNLQRLRLLSMVGLRYQFKCPRCDLNVVAGDRLGHGGQSVLVTAESGSFKRSNYDGRDRTAVVLHELANRGVPRVTLVTLGRIVSV